MQFIFSQHGSCDKGIIPYTPWLIDFLNQETILKAAIGLFCRPHRRTNEQREKEERRGGKREWRDRGRRDS